MVAGCEISVSTPPRLSPSEHSAHARSSGSAASRRAEVERDQRAEAGGLAACGPRGPDGRRSPASSTCVDLRLLAQERRRTCARVLLVARHAQGERLGAAQRRATSRRARGSRPPRSGTKLQPLGVRSRPARRPRRPRCPSARSGTSWWSAPTMSAPSASGRWKNGLMKVLSTDQQRPASCASAGERRDVAHLHQRVGGRLDPEHVEVAGRAASKRRGVAERRGTRTRCRSARGPW